LEQATKSDFQAAEPPDGITCLKVDPIFRRRNNHLCDHERMLGGALAGDGGLGC